MRTKIGQRLLHRLTTRGARPQATQRPQHEVDARRGIAQDLTPRGATGLLLGCACTIGGAQGVAEMRHGMRAIAPLFSKGPQLAQSAPGVRHPLGHCDDPQRRLVDPCPPHLRGQLALEGAVIGLRPTRHATGEQAVAGALIIGPGRTAHLLRACGATGCLARRNRLRPLGVPRAILPGRHHSSV